MRWAVSVPVPSWYWDAPGTGKHARTYVLCCRTHSQLL